MMKHMAAAAALPLAIMLSACGGSGQSEVLTKGEEQALDDAAAMLDERRANLPDGSQQQSEQQGAEQQGDQVAQEQDIAQESE